MQELSGLGAITLTQEWNCWRKLNAPEDTPNPVLKQVLKCRQNAVPDALFSALCRNL
jgi:hypothetical protein